MSTEWHEWASCTEVDAEMFYLEPGQSELVPKARAICNGCAVQPECLAYALENNEGYGMWGGLTPRERDAVRAGRPLPQRAQLALGEIEHGTPRGYSAHRRRGEQGCPDCWRARTEHRAEKERLKRERQKQQLEAS